MNHLQSWDGCQNRLFSSLKREAVLLDAGVPWPGVQILSPSLRKLQNTLLGPSNQSHAFAHQASLREGTA